jgi:nitrate reductase NapE component
MAFKSKPKRTSDDAVVAGLKQVFTAYDPVVFSQKAFEGLLADHIPGAYAFKARLTLMAKSGYLLKLLKLGNAGEQALRYAEQFADYYGFEKGVILRDFKLILRAIGVTMQTTFEKEGAAANEKAVDSSLESRMDTESARLHRGMQDGPQDGLQEVAQDTKNRQRSKRTRRRQRQFSWSGLGLWMIFFIVLIGGYLYQIDAFQMKQTAITGVETYLLPLNQHNPWLVFGLVGTMAVSAIAAVVQKRLDVNLISVLPWLMVIIQCGLAFFKVQMPQFYEFIQFYMLVITAVGFVLLQTGVLRTKGVPKGMISFYLLGTVYLVSQYIVRTVVS